MWGNWEFQVSTRIQFGWGSASKLAQMLREWGRRVFWIGYQNPGALANIYKNLRCQLRQADLMVEEFFEVVGEPDVALVNRAAEAARSFCPELILAIGGGSVLDTAKAVAALARREGRLEEYLPLPTGTGLMDPQPTIGTSASAMEQGQTTGPATSMRQTPVRVSTSARPMDQALPIIAVPTTAGTGSEVTSLAVFHWQDPAGDEMPMKLTLASKALLPKVAVVDPALSASCPPELTARCAADALAHAIEASMSRRTSPLVQLLAEEAVVQIFTHLPVVLTQPIDRRAREGLALAALLAGIALQQAGATLAHAMAHALGALTGLPHGLAVAICTLTALHYNLPEVIPLAARWASRLGLAGQHQEHLAQAFLDRLHQLFQQAGLPQGIKLPEWSTSNHPKVPADLVLCLPQKLPEPACDWTGLLAQNAFQSTSVALKLNPRKITQDSLAILFRQILLPMKGPAAG
ncbi:MAG: iron-containing alcohol dehydrogenase [Thermoguttaceae bacterium]|nr:iron-containing alcohol dehydrogenase [Thermoguttaceae bacterium]MDW8038246.1 iron-containing alcohol dehydrogenase [Thermoguttaceae bacterium]